MRRSQAQPRRLSPDPRYQSLIVTALINKVMKNGKKSGAERIVYGAFDRIEEQTGRRGIDITTASWTPISADIEIEVTLSELT